MSFHKCWNLALALFTYNDILVYGQYIYICCLSFVWIRNCDRGEICIWLYDIDSDIFQRIWNSLIYNIISLCSLPCHIIHIVLPEVFSCFLYTTQGDEEHAELQENIYTNDSQGCYIAGMRPHRKKQFPSPNTLTEILPSSDNLDSNNEIELTCFTHGAFLSLVIWMKGPGFSSTSPLMLSLKRWATHSICTQEHF